MKFKGVSGVLGLAASLEFDGALLHLRRSFRPRAVRLAGAQVGVGPWVHPGIWAPFGIVIVIEADNQRLRIGVRDRPLPSHSQSRALPPQRKVDIMVEEADTPALLAWLLPGAPPHAPAQGFPPSTSVALYPNVHYGLGGVRSMAPWLSTIAVLCIVGPVGGMLLGDSRAGIIVLTCIVVAIVAVGLVTTVRLSLRTPTPYQLALTESGCTLRDPKGGRVLDASYRELVLAPGFHVVQGRGYRSQLPTLTLQTADGKSHSLGVWDQRFGWHGPVPKSGKPRWLVGTAEWLPLLARLGVHGATKGV